MWHTQGISGDIYVHAQPVRFGAIRTPPDVAALTGLSRLAEAARAATVSTGCKH